VRRGRVYLVEAVADAAELGGELAGRADDGLEEALRDLQQVPLVLLQVLPGFQPEDRAALLLSLSAATCWRGVRPRPGPSTKY